MTVRELVLRLNDIEGRGGYDKERDHIEADELLLEYINDPLVTEAFEEIGKWYA